MLSSAEIGTLITALGTGISDEFDLCEAPLPQDHHHDRRRRRRLAYPDAVAHLLLSPDEVADRAGAPLHRPAAPLQGVARQVRALPQGREGTRGISRRRRPRRCAAHHRRQCEPGRRRLARHRRDRAQDRLDPQRSAQPLSALHRRAGGDRRRAQSESAEGRQALTSRSRLYRQAARCALGGDRARLARRGASRRRPALLARASGRDGIASDRRAVHRFGRRAQAQLLRAASPGGLRQARHAEAQGYRASPCMGRASCSMR